MKCLSSHVIHGLSALLMVILLLVVSGMSVLPASGAPNSGTALAKATPTPEPTDVVPQFATYVDPVVTVEPGLEVYPIVSNLENVLVPFVLSPEQRLRLEQDGVVVSPGVEKEFFALYEKARYDNLPIFVTSDSLVHTYHLLFDKTLRTLEKKYLVPELQALNRALLAECDQQYRALSSSKAEWKDAALRTVAFVGVASRLLDAKAAIPDYAAELVNDELALIEAAEGIRPSSIFPTLEYGEDYTQYIPRGHYTTSDTLRAYFKAMMWYGRMTFRLSGTSPERGRAETRAALLLTHALRRASVDGRPAAEVWADIYAPTAFFVGRSDDLTVIQYGQVMDAVYGRNVTLGQLADDERLERFIQGAQSLPAPRILGMVISADQDEERASKGMRLMGQRFVPDAYIFRQLIWRNVGEATERRRGLPKGLDLFAAMGSERAYQLLDQLGDTGYLNYPAQMQKVQDWLAGLSVHEQTETLYTAWLYTLRPLLEVPGAGYPGFMQSLAWQDKQLSTALGSWAELKHDTILLAKQVYAEMGGGGPAPPEPKLLRGYVEPVPLFYARLTALIDMTLQGLEPRGLLDDQDRYSLLQLRELSVAFQAMAEKELRGQALSEQEHNTIRYYGGALEHLVMAAADTPDEGGMPVMDEQPQAAVIADVATDPDPDGDGVPNPVVLQVGVGRVNDLYAVVPMVDDDGSTYLQVAKGGVFSYYEFPWPAEDRLTDEAWRRMLDQGTAPPRPQWTDSFMTEQTEQSELQRVLYTFQQALTWAYWTLDYDAYWEDRVPMAQALREFPQGRETGVSYVPQQSPLASETVRRQLEPELEALRTANQYVGHQLISSNYRSFDRQASNKIVVTVRETWQDWLYNVVEFFGDDQSQPVKQRGPYTLDVTYTLEKSDGDWLVTSMVYTNQPPAWR